MSKSKPIEPPHLLGDLKTLGLPAFASNWSA